ncbi:MAG: hypothetical protein GVY16_02475 [Planctomycetes bacterium]|jgi:hypothetical protein|nr:hypothetical protein [Phycisphaerae bacterium]NBB94583.1 hypothetical protein [Planctomycetota bacterium]
MKPVYMATPWSQEQCVNILRRALEGVGEKMPKSKYRLREVNDLTAIDFEWPGRMSLGLDLATAGKGSLLRMRYAIGRTAKLVALACWPVTVVACLVAGALLPEPLVDGMSNILLLGLAGIVAGAFETGVLMLVLSLPAMKLVRGFGKALQAKELTGENEAHVAEVFRPLDNTDA